jgi:hypothetical protein
VSRGDYDDRDRYDDRDDRDRYDGRDDRRGGYDDDAEDIRVARKKVKPAAICLLIAGVLYLGVVAVSGVVSAVFFDQQWDEAIARQEAQQQGRQQQQQAARDFMKDFKPVAQVLTLAVVVVFALLAALIIFGSTRMLSLSSRAWGMAAAIISFIPLSCYVWPLGVAFGIWAIVVLGNPDVKRGFAAKARSGGGGRDGRDEYDDRDDRR